MRSPSPSMSIAPREPKWMIRWSRWNGHAGSTQRVSASPSAAHQRGAERARARGRERPTARRPRAAATSTGPDDLGDDVAGLADDHGVAGAHVLGRDLVLVVQRGQADGGAADEHRLEHGERRRPAGAPDRHHDVLEQRRALLRRELVGDGPAGRLRREAELLALREVVDLHDDAVDLVAEVVAVLLPALAVAVTSSSDDERPGSPGSPGSPARARQLERLVVAGELRPADDLARAGRPRTPARGWP